MPNYQLGKIYKIVDNTNNNIYVGSTCEPTLARRLSDHVRKYKAWKNGKSNYTSSYKIIENQNYDIVLLENCPCESKDELYKRERHYIETLNCVNKVIVGRTKKESNKAYQFKNKVKIIKYRKQYQDENSEKLKEVSKNYREENREKLKKLRLQVCNCICGKEYTHGNKNRHEKSQFHQKFINSQEQN